jgi:hypothetical protein
MMILVSAAVIKERSRPRIKPSPNLFAPQQTRTSEPAAPDQFFSE